MRIQDRDTAKHIDGHQMTLLVAVVGDRDAHCEIVVIRNRAASTGASHRHGQRTSNQCNGILVESHVIVTKRPEIDQRVISDGDIEGSIERDANQTSHGHDTVQRRVSPEAHKLANLRCDSEAIDRNFLGIASCITRWADRLIHSASDAGCDDSRRDDRIDQGRRDRDAHRVTKGFAVSRHLMRHRLTSDGDPVAIGNRTSESIRRQHRGACRQVAAIDGTCQIGVAGTNHGHILVHPEIPTQLPTEGSVPQRLALIADHLSLGEDVEVQEFGFSHRIQNQVAAGQRRLVDVQNLAELKQLRFRVAAVQTGQTASRVREELRILAKDHHIEELGDTDDLWLQELVNEVLERLALFAVADDDRNVNVLIQLHFHIGSRHVLDDDIVSHNFPLGRQRTGFRHIDHVAVFGKDVLEVAEDQIAGHHVLDQDRERLVSPHFRDEHINAILTIHVMGKTKELRSHSRTLIHYKRS